MNSIEPLYKLTTCHMVGDYVLQSDFLTKTKGANWWHLFAHCILYMLHWCRWKLGLEDK